MSDIENEQAESDLPQVPTPEPMPEPEPEPVQAPATEPAVVPERTLTFRGQTRTITEWASLYGIAPGVIEGRLDRGFNAERALGGPVR